MGKKYSTDIKGNFKQAVQKDELIDGAAGFLLAPLIWGLVPTLVNKIAPDSMKGWLGYVCAFGLTWGTGAAFNIPGLRIGAFALAGTHLLYAKGGGFVQQTLGTPLWSMGGSSTAVAPAPIINTLPDTDAGTTGDYFPADEAYKTLEVAGQPVSSRQAMEQINPTGLGYYSTVGDYVGASQANPGLTAYSQAKTDNTGFGRSIF